MPCFNYRTAIGIRGKDGIVFGVEKLVTSKLYEVGANKRIFNVDKHIGMVSFSKLIIIINCYLLRRVQKTFIWSSDLVIKEDISTFCKEVS